MKIALWNLEPHIINSAMMRVSQYYKKQGDQVELYSPLFHSEYDKIYVFSIFKFTSKSGVDSSFMECGGTGFDPKIKLPPEIEAEEYDWSLYPKCDFSIIWFSIGCIRDCPFCIVRQKEGFIKSIKPKNLNPNGNYIKVMDNNFFANPKWKDAIKQLQEWKQAVDFQGVDVRLINKEMCDALNTLKHKKCIKIAWDNAKIDLRPKIKEITKWIKPYKLMCYVLIGFDSTPEDDLYRVEELRKLRVMPFAMPFDKTNRYQKDFARWVNRKELFKSCSFKDYLKSRRSV